MPVCQQETFGTKREQRREKVGKLSGLVTVYRQCAPAYAALTDRLARTDRVIDQIVYRLYGLTPEEIAIVEGSRA